MAHEGPPVSLLELPEPCLLAVLQCLADDPASLCSAARAHSRLHQTAVVALSSISTFIKTQQQLDNSLLPYLSQHGQHVSSMQLCAQAPHVPTSSGALKQLPPNLQLASLQIGRFRLQLQPVGGYQGVLGAAGPHLKQLQLDTCTLLDGDEGLAAALPTLIGLQQLSVVSTMDFWRSYVFPTQLTYLDIDFDMPDNSPVADSSLLQLQKLPRLQHLYLNCRLQTLTADALSGLSNLTHLSLEVEGNIKPGVLADKPQLQHLKFLPYNMPDGAAGGLAQHLQHLQDLQQLTYLEVFNINFYSLEQDGLPASAFSALTASSQLQYLDVTWYRAPADPWQHMFRNDRQLPRLHTLKLSGFRQKDLDLEEFPYVAPPQGSRLVASCPALQFLHLDRLWSKTYVAELIVQLAGRG